MVDRCPSCNAVVPPQAAYCFVCGIRLSIGTAPLRPDTRAGSTIQPGDLIGGRYRIQAPLATGSMGAVWRATDERLHGRLCAVKCVLLGGSTADEAAERRDWFIREATVLAQLHHPSICDIRDLVTEDGIQYMIMDYVEGHTLAQELADHGNPGLPEATVVTWAATLCEALAYLHAQTPPIIFRDLKPQNVMLRTDGRLTLIDFGIARFKDSHAGTAIGTGGYAPPEQYQGLATARSDIYGLAATLHHLLTGRDPSVEQPFTFPPVRPLIPSVSRHVDAALQRALSMRPDDRYATAGEFLHALQSAKPAGLTLSSRRTGGLSHVVRPPDQQAFLDACCNAMEDLVDRRVLHRPQRALGALVEPQAIVAYLPFSIHPYTIHANLYADGVAHAIDDAGSTILYANDGTPVNQQEARLVAEWLVHLDLLQGDDDMRASAQASILPLLPEDALQRHSLDSIIRRHTQTVSVSGPDGRQQPRELVPRASDVQLSAMVVFQIMICRRRLRFAGKDYSFDFGPKPQTWQPFLLHTDLPEQIPLCQRCGCIDDRLAPCIVCGTYVCSACHANPGTDCCSAECVGQLQLLNQIRDQPLRDLLLSRSEAVLQVPAHRGTTVVLTDTFVYIAGKPVIKVARADSSAVFVAPTGKLLRRWEVRFDPESGPSASYIRAREAQDVAEAIRRWATRQPGG